MKLQTTSLTYVVITTQGTYHFSVSSDSSKNVTVSNIKRNSISWMGSYPSEVHTAINTAISTLEAMMAGISTLSGTVTLVNISEGQVLFNTPFANTSYRVLFTIDDFIPVRVKTRTTTGFTFELGVAFTGDLKYDILV